MGYIEFTDTIEVSARLRVRLHRNTGNIVLETGVAGDVDVARTILRDPEALVRALNEIALIQAERLAALAREARATEPIDDATRKAVFAALREYYLGELPDDERLAVVSKLAGHDIWSMSRRGNMTMADGHRVLDILNELGSHPGRDH